MQRSRLEVESLARALRVTPERINAWREGIEQPSYAQAKKLAQKLHIPFSQLFVPPPDQIQLPLPDFRRGPAHGKEPSPELVEAIYDALRKRDWYRAYRHSTPHALCPFVGSATLDHHPEDVAQAIRDFVPVQALQRQTTKWQQFLTKIVESVESIGILVLRQGYVATNTHRPYDPAEFSGFAIADEVAPVIFLNNRDFVARLSFTLAHELAHIWLGQSALDAELDTFEASTPSEDFCDRVAAELLMPSSLFVETWQGGDPFERAQEQAFRFKVSAWAALRRAQELGLIREGEYREAFIRIRRETKKEKRAREGGNFWTNIPIRNSPTFTKVVVQAALRGEMSPKEVASLLNLRLGTALDYLDRTAASFKVNHVYPS